MHEEQIRKQDAVTKDQSVWGHNVYTHNQQAVLPPPPRSSATTSTSIRKPLIIASRYPKIE